MFFLCIAYIIPLSVYFFDYNFSEVVTKFAFATAPSQLWFIWMLFDVFILIWLLSNRIKESNLFACFISVLLIFVGTIASKFALNVFCIWTACKFISYFVIGFKIRQHSLETSKKLSAYYLFIVHIILFTIIHYIGSYNGIVFKIIKLGLNIGLQVAGALLAFIILLKIAEYFDWKNNRLFMALSEKSMIIFLFHQQIIYFTITWFNGVVNPYWNIVINFIVSIVGSYIIGHFALKNKYLRILLGEK